MHFSILHILRTSWRVGNKDDGDTPENLETDEVKEEDKKHPSSEGGSKAAEKLPATGHVQECKSARVQECLQSSAQRHEKLQSGLDVAAGMIGGSTLSPRHLHQATGRGSG